MRWDRRLGDDAVLGIGLVPSSTPHTLIALADLDAFASKVPELLGELLDESPDFELLGKERSVEVYCRPVVERGAMFFEVHDDGRLVCAFGPAGDGRGAMDFASSFIIDEERLEADANKMSEVFHRMLGALDQRRRITTVYVQASLRGIRNKKVDLLPKEAMSSMMIPSHDLPDPLSFPSAPMRVAVAELQGQMIGRTLRATVKRIFAEATRPPV